MANPMQPSIRACEAYNHPVAKSISAANGNDIAVRNDASALRATALEDGRSEHPERLVEGAVRVSQHGAFRSCESNRFRITELQM